MSLFLKAKSLAKKRGGGRGNPTLYSPENHPAHKDTTFFPSSHRFLQHESPPTPSQPVETRECHFWNPLFCLEVGSHQLWGHWPRPNVESHWEGSGSVTPKDQRLCFLLLLQQLQAWSSLCSVMWHGSDYWEQSNAVRCPQRGWVQPRKRSSFLDSKIQEVTFEVHSKRRKKICW